MAGHLFVVQTDIRHLHVDAWMFPTDQYGGVRHAWHSDDPHLSQRVMAWRALGTWSPSDDKRVGLLGGGEKNSPLVVMADTAVAGGSEARIHARTVAQMIELVRRWRPTVERPVIAVPAMGTGAGGAFEVSGGLIAQLMPLLRDLSQREDVDIVLGLRDADAAAAARAVRRSVRRDEPRVDWWPELSKFERETAETLAARAVRRELTVFTGAGTGRAAGLPGWNELLVHLEGMAGLDSEQLKSASVLDRATIIGRKLGDDAMRSEISRLLEHARYSVQHALLANLPVAEAVTLNYDRLLEHAAVDCQREFAVLPYEPARGRWLLKLHGDVGPEREHDIVLTRLDYLQAGRHRASLTGLVQAVLTTRHMLFVGFGLADDHIHALMHDVEEALGQPQDRKFGTALLVHDQPLVRELWSGNLELLVLDDGDSRDGRRIEIFLDLLANLADPSYEHLLDDRWAGALTEDERALRAIVAGLIAELPHARSAAWDPLTDALVKYGWTAARRRDT